MKDLRRIRFATIDGLRRSELPLACDIWADDLYRAPWGTRETMKLGAFLVRYITDGMSPNLATLGGVELRTQLGRDEVKQALKTMYLYRAIEAYSIEKNELRVALRLSDMQRALVLEAAERLESLVARRPGSAGIREPRWLPSGVQDDLDDEAPLAEPTETV